MIRGVVRVDPDHAHSAGLIRIGQFGQFVPDVFHVRTMVAHENDQQGGCTLEVGQ
jgi:hypothetical protein